ncbi:PQQ-dependent sugar dehydrogenase [Gordonia sinesedis]
MRCLAMTATVLGVLTACSSESSEPDTNTSGASATTAAPSAGGPQTVTDGLDAPWSIAFRGTTPLVSERDTARILEVASDGRTREVGRVADAEPRGEGGLLGIAVRDNWLYAYLTTRSDNRIQRFALSGDAGNLTIGRPETILDGLPAASIHNGGRIAFGPDGMLYATVGDAGQRDNAQDRTALGGKILRMTATGQVPEDNPFPRSLVYSYGHRNVQGIAWGDDGTLYASEFGQNTWDELNVIRPGGNYGWPIVEGIGETNDSAYIDPVQQWPTDEASPSGIAFRGNNIVIANLRGERLREVPVTELSSGVDRFTNEYGRLRDAVNAPDGSLWIVTNNTDGRGTPRESDDRILRVPDSSR